MSHAEIWDDSALVDSWNEALEEYKHYHSVHAGGEKIDQLLQNQKDANSHNPDARSLPFEDPRGCDPEETKRVETVDGQAAVPLPHSGTEVMSVPVVEQSSNQSSSGIPSIPQHLIGSVHDEGLKNLLMSWYYAGYYTGLYEGRQSSGVAPN